MNVIAQRPKIQISMEERARRKAAIDYARGSIRLEGFILPDTAEEIYSRFMEGELTPGELRTAILAEYKL